MGSHGSPAGPEPTGGGSAKIIPDLIDTTTGDTLSHELRLAVKPESGRGGKVDGAWWPWSTDPAAEFPPLIAALGVHDPVRRVAYHLRTWQRTATRMAVDGVAVRLEGFPFTHPDTVNLIRADRTRIRLVVVPPGTPGGVALAVLHDASTSDSATTVEEILAGNGLSSGRR
ncbi:DUF5994 family protein [Actinosynnema sp. NPDC047251]|uniref:DUF5994 family protein n=1 Tax=Saccharothrix espanaensis TaxID=103731 RepID=UPI0002FF7245|nr:DUF5994 family protein [Saccharothrix espanaensis]